MQIAPMPLNEAARQCYLQSLDILDTPPEETFDRLTRLACVLLDAPMALVSLIDVNRQWFKSRQGLEITQTSRDLAFCAHALHAEDMLLIPDACADPRFADNPLVTGGPRIRFYAGVPLRFADDLTLGTLCVLDTRPRQLTQTELAHLRDLARIVEREMLHRSLAKDAGSAVEQAGRTAKASAQAHFHRVFDNSPTSKALVSPQGRIQQANREFCQLLGRPKEALVLTQLRALIDPQDQATLDADWQRIVAGELDSQVSEVRLITTADPALWAELSLSALRDAQGAIEQLVVLVRDISARKRRQQQLQRYQSTLEQQVAQRTEELARSQETLQAIADNLPVLIAHIGTDLAYRFNNAVYRQIFGVEPTQLKGRKVEDVLPAQVYAQLLPYFRKALAGERVEADDVRYSPHDARIWHATYVPDIRNGKVEGFFVMSLDVTERKHKERLLLDQATLDPLTGLPNRAALHQSLALALQQRAALALLFIDLDGFKQVNDQHGHEAGDAVLQAAAGRMLAAMRADDTVARLAGDEFVIIARGVNSQASARDIARKLCAALAAPIVLAGAEVKIGASIGVYLNAAGQPPQSAEQALALADQAMYSAKRAGRNGFSVSQG